MNLVIFVITAERVSKIPADDVSEVTDSIRELPTHPMGEVCGQYIAANQYFIGQRAGNRAAGALITQLIMQTDIIWGSAIKQVVTCPAFDGFLTIP